MPETKKIRNAAMMHRLLNKEYLAHTLAYASKDTNGNDICDDSIISLPCFSTNDGEPINATIHKIVTGHSSLVGYIVEIDDHKLTPRVEIIWRGTHNLASAHMDLESDGAGAKSYQAARKRIIPQINAVIEHLHNKTGARVIVGVSGHSLGGALAQRCLTDLACSMVQNDADQKKISEQNTDSKINQQYTNEIIDLASKHGFEAKDRENININNILKLELGAFNSTGVDNNTYNNSHKFSEYLQNPFYKYKQGKSFSITADYCLNSRDGVQQTGSKNILASCPFANVNLFKFNPSRNVCKQMAAGLMATAISAPLGPVGMLLAGLSTYKGIGTMDSHTSKHSSFENYNLVLHSRDFEIYSNKKPNNGGRDPLGEAKISHQLLGRKSFIANNFLSSMLTKSMHVMTYPIIGDTIKKEADLDALIKIEKIRQKTNNLKMMRMVATVGG